MRALLYVHPRWHPVLVGRHADRRMTAYTHTMCRYEAHMQKGPRTVLVSAITPPWWRPSINTHLINFTNPGNIPGIFIGSSGSLAAHALRCTFWRVL